MIEMLVILVLLLIILILAVLVKLEFRWIERKIYRGDQQKMIKRGTSKVRSRGNGNPAAHSASLAHTPHQMYVMPTDRTSVTGC